MTVVDLAGTYVAETSPGSGEQLNHPDWRMLVAVIETPEPIRHLPAPMMNSEVADEDEEHGGV